MSKEKRRVPKLRFPGFTKDWEQRKLSDISTKVTTKNVDVHYTETLTNSAEQGIISQVDFFDKEISNKDNINGYYIVDNNDFIYNPRISTLAPVGPINRNKLNRTGIMSPLYTVFRSSNVDLGFLEWYFQSNHWHRYMKLNGDSGARADRIAIKDSTFFEMPIKTPVNIKEQVLIGETLEKFNQYITLHQRKLDNLKLKKKALLQKLFPRNGERYPELRFPGFTDAWEQCKVNDIFKITRGQVLATSLTTSKKTRQNIYPVYSSQTKNNGLMGYYSEYLFENAITWTTDGANAGTVNFRPGRFYSTNVNGVLINENGYACYAVSEIINKVAYKYVSKVGNPKLMNNVMAEIDIMITANIGELGRISKLIETYNKLITLHQRKLDHLQLQKKALLQQMFV